MSFFKELKRRNVFRVGIAYSITTWLIAQIAGLAATSFLAPEWVMKMIITLLILGFPIAMLMAWAYELTPEGLRRETDIEPGQSMAKVNAGKLDRTITIALLLAVAYFSYDKFVLDPQRDAVMLETARIEGVASISAEVAQTNASPATENTNLSPVTQAPAEQVPSIAVLPFINMSDDAANEYFSDGLSEELLNLLVKIPQLQVAARTSSFSYKGTGTKIAQIGQELNVAHVLEGSVRKAGNHIRITAQLIKTADGFHLWSETYDRTLEDIFVTQDEIAAAVVEALKLTLLGALPEVRPTDPEVYALYLQGMYFNNLQGKENLEKSLAAYQQALAIDPDYAPAWVGINVAYQAQRKFGWRSADQAAELSMAAVQRALAIDDNLASAWASLAYLKRRQLDWTGAKVAIDKAMKLEPNNALVIGTAASLAGNYGQLETSIELFERNVKLNPLSLSTLRALGIRYADIGRFDDALKMFNRVIAINPDYPGIHSNIGMAGLFEGKLETAWFEMNRDPIRFTYPYQKVMILSAMGRDVEAQAIIKQLLETSAHHYPDLMAATFAWRGEKDLAFEWYERAFQQEPSNLAYFLRRPWNKNLENDPRYPVFVEKLGLLEAWKTMPRPAEEARP